MIGSDTGPAQSRVLHRLARFGARIASSPAFFAVLFGLGALLGVYADLHSDEIVAVAAVRSGYFGGSFAPHAAVFYGGLLLLVAFTGSVQWAADLARRRDEERRAADEHALIDATARLNEQVRASNRHRAAAERRLLAATMHLEEAHQRRADAEARLIEGTRQVRHLVRTLPPTTALTTFDEIELQAQDVLAEVQERFHAGRFTEDRDILEPADVAAAVRVVLKGVAKLVAVFDAGGHDTTYFANLVRFVDVATLGVMPEVARAQLAQRMLPPSGAIPFRGVRGVLVPEQALSTSSRADRESVRGAPLLDVVFVVPEVALERALGTSEPRWRVLPGPALAFCQRSSVLFHDQRAILRWCHLRGEYPDGTIQRLDAYLRSDIGATMQGLLSVPIIGYGEQSATDERIPAVLNVHCDEAGLLRGRHVRRHLLPLLYPLTGVLRRLLSILARVESPGGKGGSPDDTRGGSAGFAHSMSSRHTAMDRLAPRRIRTRRQDGMTTMQIVEMDPSGAR